MIVVIIIVLVVRFLRRGRNKDSVKYEEFHEDCIVPKILNTSRDEEGENMKFPGESLPGIDGMALILDDDNSRSYLNDSPAQIPPKST